MQFYRPQLQLNLWVSPRLLLSSLRPGSPAIIADSLLSTSELWSESPIRGLGGVDGESNKSVI